MGRRSIVRTIAGFMTAMLVVAACGGASGPGGAAFAPTRPAEFVISTPPGGGSDIYARFWIGIIEQLDLSAQPVQPVNKEGGAGAVAFTYVFEKKNDPHYLMVTLNSFWTTIITQKLPYKTTDFTPIALLAFDPFFLWVNADSPIKTAQDFVAAAKEREITVSGTGAKQEDEVLFRRIQKLAGTKTFNYIPQSGGGAVAAALAGKQGGVEVTVNNPSEGAGLQQQGKVRAICAFLSESPKDGQFAGLPTCTSQGLAIDDYFNVRSVVAPPGLSQAQQAYWVEVFRKVSESQQWQDFVKENALIADFRGGAEFTELVNEFETVHREIAEENGWIQ